MQSGSGRGRSFFVTGKLNEGCPSESDSIGPQSDTEIVSR